MKIIRYFLLLGLTISALGLGFIYSGLYPMGADNRHNAVTYWLLETMREKSIARSSSDIDVPDLSSPDLLLAGGADYNDMCSGCHLQPGISESDLSVGLYPSPPNLASALDEHGHEHKSQVKNDDISRRNFWIIKHGIKASGMPAWGPTHSDDRIWAMVAFLNKLPELSAEQYLIITARAENAMTQHD